MPQVLAAMLATYRSQAKPNQLERTRRDGRTDAERMGEDAGVEHLRIRLEGLEAEADDVRGRYEAHYGEQLHQYDEEVQRLDDEAVQVFTNQEHRIRREKEDAVRALHQATGPGSKSWNALAEKDADTKRAFDTKKRELDGRPPRIHLRSIYLPLMATLSVAESPINRLAFELFFGSTPVIALGAAFLAGAILMFLAHALGINLLRWRANFRRVAATIVIVCFAGFLMYGLSILRNEFASLAQTSGPSLGDLLREGADYGAIGAAILSNGLGQDALALLAINATLVVVGTIAAIYRHDPDPDYEGILKNFEEARRNLTPARTSTTEPCRS